MLGKLFQGESIGIAELIDWVVLKKFPAHYVNRKSKFIIENTKSMRNNELKDEILKSQTIYNNNNSINNRNKGAH